MWCERERAPRLLRTVAGWFRDNRDPEKRGVAVAVHPWETGRDNAPEWDAPGEPIALHLRLGREGGLRTQRRLVQW
jgi:hypothetical protein